MTTPTVPTLSVETGPWPLHDVSVTQDAPPGNLFLTTIYINGIAHHLQALRINDDGDAYEGGLQPELDSWYALYENPWQTIEIDGVEGDFVVVVHPHGG